MNILDSFLVPASALLFFKLKTSGSRDFLTHRLDFNFSDGTKVANGWRGDGCYFFDLILYFARYSRIFSTISFMEMSVLTR